MEVDTVNGSENSSLCEQSQDSGQVIRQSSGGGKVFVKNYVLNDIAALKKKIRHEGRKEAFTMDEAKDGSNTVTLSRTSFFEHIKLNFLDALQKMKGITRTINATAVKAATEVSGDAFVELSLEISFMVTNTEYTVKLTAYTTTC